MKVSFKSCLGVGAMIAFAMGSSVAFAGYTYHQAVVVEYASGFASSYAYGQVGYARNSPDQYQEIGCEVTAPAGGTPSAYCYAQDSQSNYLSCNSTDANIVATARSVTAASYIWISEFEGTCMNLQVTNGSNDIY
jgi:hypothetical protein